MSRQQQPFRFWFPYWGNPTPAPTQRPTPPPPQRTLSRVPTSAPSRPPTATSTAPSQPTTSRRASQPSPASSPLPSPSRRSPRSQPADQRAAAAQRPSPSRPASKPPSPSRPTATKAESQPSQPPMQSETQVKPSTPPPPSVSQSEATANQFPPESQKPEEKLQKLPSADSLLKDVATKLVTTSPVQPEKSESQPKEIEEEKPEHDLKPKDDVKTSETLKQDEKPPLIPEPKPDLEPKLEIATSEIPKLDENTEEKPDEKLKPMPQKEEVKSESISEESNENKPKPETETSEIPKLDEKTKERPQEKLKPKPEKQQQEEKPAQTLKSESKFEESNENKPKPEMKPEEDKNQNIATNEPEKIAEPKLSIIVSDSEPMRPELNTRELVAEIKVREEEQLKKHAKESKKELPPNSTNGKGSRISISSTPWSSSSHGERASFQKEIKEGLSKLVQKLSTGQAGPTGSDQSVSIITLAGQNKGATMFIGNGFDQKQRENKLIRATSDEERSKDASNNDSAIAASVNSNVQSINNSVLNESSCEERNPGVHLILSTKPTEPVSLRGRMEPLKPQKTASNLTTPQKLTYEPNIRRRCLRGLFMEPSEDDQEDPQKPQRHGCRVSCDDKKKGKANDEEGTSKPNGNGNS